MSERGDKALENTRGSLSMVLAMAAFAVEDMLIKAAAQSVPVGFALAVFGLGGLLVFVVMCKRRAEPLLPAVARSRAVLIRACCEVLGRLSFALAITLTTLSSASAILQATPLIAMLGAASFFGERIGVERWCAVAVGFLGVLMI
ncbi:MAG: EamA family transporter, partial [Granulosicoccaceae bacterium]